MNVTLIGMPGAGKSTVGAALARALGYCFLDTDHSIEQVHGNKPLQEIVTSLGNAFRDIEELIVLKTTNTTPLENTIIATGGSVVYGKRAMEHLRRISFVCFLDVPETMLLKRIGGTPRGISSGGLSFSELFQERRVLYKRYAHAHLDGAAPPEEVAAHLARLVRAQSGTV